MKALATWSPSPSLNATAVEREETRWPITVYNRECACCPVCGVQSRSRHSFYSRTLGDLSAQGTPVTIGVRVGRWRCRNERCDRRIFAERLPGIAAPSARQTDRLAEIVRLFGHSAGGRPSARLMARLGMRVSHTTILRRLKQHAGTNAIGPRSGSLVSMSGLGGRVRNSARLSWTWSAAVWWICWQIARRTEWQIG
jgi:transposase